MNKETQIEEFMDCWGDYFDGYICCQGFGCSCNGTETDVEVIKHLKQALTTAEARGAREGERKLLEDFAEYAHTRYNGCVHDGEWQYQYNTEVVCMIDDYLKEKLSALDTK